MSTWYMLQGDEPGLVAIKIPFSFKATGAALSDAARTSRCSSVGTAAHRQETAKRAGSTGRTIELKSIVRVDRREAC